MSGQPYDLVIIGGGPGGYVGAIRAAQLGLRTALVEREKVGGTCLHIGCIPTKAMLHTAEVLGHLRDAADLGIMLAGEPALDLAAVHKRKARVVETLHKGTQYLMRKNKIDVFAGTGRFLTSRKIGVALADGSETELEASAVIIATGSAPRSIPGVSIDHKRIIDSTGALELQTVPKAIALHVPVALDWPQAWCCGTAPGNTQRAGILAQLERSDGRHLVIVRYPANHDVHDEWVYNRAEIDGAKVRLAAESFRAAGVEGLITQVHGDALKEIPKLQGPFEFVFIDAWKNDYVKYLDLVLPMVPPGGIIMAHNTKNLRSQLEDFIQKVTHHPQLDTVLVEPGPGGFSVSVKRPAK